MIIENIKGDSILTIWTIFFTSSWNKMYLPIKDSFGNRQLETPNHTLKSSSKGLVLFLEAKALMERRSANSANQLDDELLVKAIRMKTG